MLGLGEVLQHAKGNEDSDRPEGCGIAEQLGHHTAHEDAQAHADVPGDENGGVGDTAGDDGERGAGVLMR